MSFILLCNKREQMRALNTVNASFTINVSRNVMPCKEKSKSAYVT